jgi:hypothetical protein
VPEVSDYQKGLAGKAEAESKSAADAEKAKFEREKFEEEKRKNRAAEAQRGNEPSENDNRKFSQENQLRTQLGTMSKDFVSVRDSYKRIKSSIKNPSPAGDLALIFNYMKMLDPGSTVRESEFANAAATGSYGERFKAATKRLVKGERLTDEQRADFLASTESLFKEQKDSFGQLKNKYTTISKGYGLDPEKVVSGFSIEDEESGESTKFNSLEEAEAANLPAGTVVYIDGRKAVVE